MTTKDSVHSAVAVADSGGVQGHTPGPWRFYEAVRNNDVCFDIAQEDGAPYTPNLSDVCYSRVPFQTYANEYLAVQRANARLIAAAPKLADAVEMLLDVLDELDGECSGVAEFQAPIRMARAIHAQATGAKP